METKIKNSYKKIHIGNAVWGCGKINENYQNTHRKHLVIYGPHNTQYHIYDKDVEFITMIYGDYYGEKELHRGHINRYGNYAIESKLKIYILTHILDDKNNWLFDLNAIPKNGKLKVIYENGTIKNINFNGMFIDEEIPYSWSNDKTLSRPVKAFGYRIKL